MPLTKVEQIQLDKSGLYDDTLTPSAYASAVSVQDDLNFIRSQVLDILGADNANWYEAPTITLSGLKARATLEARYMIRRRQVLTDLAVPAAQNFVVLSQAGGTAPTRPIAIGAATPGAVSAQLPGAVGSHSLVEVAGINAINPKNLVHVIDGTTGDSILSSGRIVLALLQVSSTATDGANFDDTSNRGQLSFVRANATYDDLEACPVADIQGKSVIYNYPDRVDMASANEQDFDPGSIFADQAAAVDVTLQNAISNQTGTVTQGAKDITVQLSDNYKWEFNSPSAANILAILALAAGDQVNVGTGANAVAFKGFGTGEFVDGLAVDTGGTTINVGTTAGEIDASALVLRSSVGNLTLNSAGELYLKDSRLGTAVPLTDVANTTLPGSAVSIYDAINKAYNSGGTTRKDANTTGAVSANTLIVGPGGVGTQNLSAVLCDYTGKVFTDSVLIWINGVYQRPGANSGANHDVYPATVAGDIAVGGFFCESNVKNGANIMMMMIG